MFYRKSFPYPASSPPVRPWICPDTSVRQVLITSITCRKKRNTSDPEAVHSIVTPGTFAALGIPLKSGRDFNDNDTRDKPFVAVVNEALVKRSFSGENPIGRTIFCPFDSDKAMTVIGVVGNVRENGPAHDPIPECYMSYRQHVYNNTSLSIVTRTIGNPTALQETLRRLAHQRSPDVPVTFTTMEQAASENVAAPRFRTLCCLDSLRRWQYALLWQASMA